MMQAEIPLSSYQDIAPLCRKGHVVLVKNRTDGQLYVKKRLCDCNPEVFVQLQKHAVANTPRICGIYEEPEGLVVVEEYLPGNTLAERIEQSGVLDEKETISIALQLCAILRELHALRPAVIHRDIKPSNILLSPDGTVKLLDFNAAKLQTSASRDTVLLGTEGYAAPEQYGFSASSCQTDIYAVGVLMNVCRTGYLPAQNTADGKLQQVIRRCTALDPKDRYRGARELIRALKKAKRTKLAWLPPGFRTLRPYKMVPAVLGYMLLAALVLDVDTETFGSIAHANLYRCFFLFWGLGTVFFYTDYLSCRRYFPFMRSRRTVWRLLGILLAPVFLFWVGIVTVAMVDLFFV